MSALVHEILRTIVAHANLNQSLVARVRLAEVGAKPTLPFLDLFHRILRAVWMVPSPLSQMAFASSVPRRITNTGRDRASFDFVDAPPSHLL
jgi:hypothetical protein